MCGTLQTNKEHKGRQFHYCSTSSFSAHSWFPLGNKSGRWPRNSLQRNLCSAFPQRSLASEIRAGPMFPCFLAISSCCKRDHWVYTKYTHYNSISSYRLRALVIKAQVEIHKKAAFAFTKRNKKKKNAHVEFQACNDLFTARSLVKCADFKSEPRPGNPALQTLLSMVNLVLHW